MPADLVNRLRNDEGGWVLATSIILLAVMLGLGLALLSIVDVQSRQSYVQRQSDAAFNLAETTLNAEGFQLAKAWPRTSDGTTGCRSLNGDLSALTDAEKKSTAAAALLRSQVVSTFSSTQAPATSTWKVAVCDNPQVVTGTGVPTQTWHPNWDKSTTDPTYDATDPAPTNGYDANNDGYLWVRAQGQVNGRRSAVASLVSVNSGTVLPTIPGMIVGGFSDDVGNSLGSATSADLIGPVSSTLVGRQTSLFGPSGSSIGLRCGVVTGCLAGALTATSGSPLNSFISNNNFVQYGSATAASDTAINDLRRQSRAANTYKAAGTVADGAGCFDGTQLNTTGPTVVFVEQVGTDGKGTCTISGSYGTATAPVILVVGSGKVDVKSGSSSSSPNRLTGVVYALNKQGDDGTLNGAYSAAKAPVVTLEGYANVTGGLYIDGQGRLSVVPPPATSTVNDALLNSVCSTVPAITQSVLTTTATAMQSVQNIINQLLSGLVSTSTTVTVDQPSDSAVCAAAKSALTTTGTTNDLVSQLERGGQITLAIPLNVTVTVTGKLLGLLTLTTRTSVTSQPITIPIALPGVPAASLANSLVNSVVPYGPVVTQDAAVTNQVKAYTSSGTVQNTFRQIPPN